MWCEYIGVMFLLFLDMYILEWLIFCGCLLLFVCGGVFICLFWPRPGGRGPLEVVVV